jgi:hypothetical protein
MRQILAPSAAFEREIRDRHYPEQLQQKKVTIAQAEADCRDWADITAWLASGGNMRLPNLPHLEQIAGRACERLERACAAKPYDRELQDRFSAVTSIHGTLQRHIADVAEINARLRDRATAYQQRAAA